LAAIPEIVRDGQTGLLVPPGDAAALAGALSALVTDPKRRACLGEAARELVLERYDAAKNASVLVDLMIDVVGARR
jgi:glycosyltransferase involved in cell wall biosynthesis